nr:hypothetical protein Iba_chr07eCG10320 [Ipomoea batatas]
MVWLSSSASCFARECCILPELSDDEGEVLSSERPVAVLRCLFSVSFVTEPSFSIGDTFPGLQFSVEDVFAPDREMFI